jgi:uncharacterized protein YkwD
MRDSTLACSLVSIVLVSCGPAARPAAPGGAGGAPGWSPPQGHAVQPAGTPPAAGFEAELALCVDETNRYRAMQGLPALRRSPELERCAAAAAATDHRDRQPHGHFMATQGCGIAFAENEIPWWPLSYAGSLRGTIVQGLADMWAEGPGGGHYENMRGNYSELGCGIVFVADEITVVQNFR